MDLLEWEGLQKVPKIIKLLDERSWSQRNRNLHIQASLVMYDINQNIFDDHILHATFPLAKQPDSFYSLRLIRSDRVNYPLFLWAGDPYLLNRDTIVRIDYLEDEEDVSLAEAINRMMEFNLNGN